MRHYPLIFNAVLIWQMLWNSLSWSEKGTYSQVRRSPPLEADTRIIGLVPSGTNFIHLLVVEGWWRARQVASLTPAGARKIAESGRQGLTKTRRARKARSKVRVGKNQGASSTSRQQSRPLRQRSRSTPGGVRGGGGQDLTKTRRVGKNQGALNVYYLDGGPAAAQVMIKGKHFFPHRLCRRSHYLL